MRACFSRNGALLVHLLADVQAGIRLNEHIEDVDGAVVFRQACVYGAGGYLSQAP